MSQLSILSRILVCTWIMIQRLPTRVLKLFIVKEEIVSQLSYFPFFGRPRSSNDDLISSIYIYIYIRTSPGTRDISIVASSACRGNNSAPTHYTSPRVVVDWTENRARIPDLLSFSFQSRPSLFPPSFSFRRVPTKGNRQVFNYPDKIGEDGPRFCPF